MRLKGGGAVQHLATNYENEKSVKDVEGYLINGTVEHETIIELLLDPIELEQEQLLQQPFACN